MLGDMSCDFQTNSVVEVALALQTDVTSARSSWETWRLLDGARAPPSDHPLVRTAGPQQREQRTAAAAGLFEGTYVAFEYLNCLISQPLKFKQMTVIYSSSRRQCCGDEAIVDAS